VPQRFCQVPTFGWDTIHHSQKNVSDLKKMVARDFEDIHQQHDKFSDDLKKTDSSSINLMVSE